jgi:hypothetical protein
MLKGTTKSGFKYEVKDETLNDYELFELISEVDTNPLVLPKMILKLLGQKQKENLINHVKKEHGTAPLDIVSNEVMEIFANKPIKNS